MRRRFPAAALAAAALLAACTGGSGEEMATGGDAPTPTVSSPSPTPEQDVLYAKVREIQDAQHLLATQTIALGDQPVQRASFTVIQGTGAFEGETTVFDPRSGQESVLETRGVESRVWVTAEEWTLPGQDECWFDTTRGVTKAGLDPSGSGEVYEDVLGSLLDHPASYNAGVGFLAAIDGLTAASLLPLRAQALIPSPMLRRAAGETVTIRVPADKDRPGVIVFLSGTQLAPALGIEPDARSQLAQLLQVLSVEMRLYPGAQEAQIEPPDPATVVRDPQACLPDDATS